MTKKSTFVIGQFEKSCLDHNNYMDMALEHRDRGYAKMTFFPYKNKFHQAKVMKFSLRKSLKCKKHKILTFKTIQPGDSSYKKQITSL